LPTSLTYHPPHTVRRSTAGSLATWWLLAFACQGAGLVDFSQTTVVIRPGTLAPAEQIAARVLVEEVKKRTGLEWPIQTRWPEHGAAIAIASGSADPGWGKLPPRRTGTDLPEHRPEGFRLVVNRDANQTAVAWVDAADSRGALFGVGQLLRTLEWGRSTAQLPAGTDIATAPARPIRGHQLGYRATANSYDGWDEAQYDQYIRELALFGANSIESIPFEGKDSPHMPLPRDVMNRKISAICARYELAYWIWSPADFDLKDTKKRAAHLEAHEALFRDCPRLDGVFFPGGDPGNNPPALVLPFLQDVAKLLVKYHPQSKVWLSLQGLQPKAVDEVQKWVRDTNPDWFGGLVAGPSSPPIQELRARLPKRYGLRDYPDITHTVRCQYPVPWWDQAFALTLGRECSNPRPAFYKTVLDLLGPFTCGFISYSDGVHDDVNKAIWSWLSWQPEAQPREILIDYARFFFGPAVAEPAADGILALEKNWEGPLAGNGGVDATFAHWQQLAAKAPDLRSNWRWQLCQLRAVYDVYTRHRLIYETALEKEANAALAQAPTGGSEAAMTAAAAALQRAVQQPIQVEWRSQIEQWCADLFRSIRLQTSVPRYQASGAERGAVLDFVDHPLNNRWWLEDEFARIRKLTDESAKLKALEILRTWEDPGPGSFYDEAGNVAKSFHIQRGEAPNTDPLLEKNPNPTFWWWDNGSNRRRLSWQTSLDWPLAVLYDNLDPNAAYVVRLTGYGEAHLRANGELLKPTVYGKAIGEFKEFPVPPGLLKAGKLKLTFDPLAEHELNWRQQSRVSEIWLLKR